MIETIIPDNKDHWLSLRSKDITSTEVSALFGCSPYMTRYELWHLKKSEAITGFEPSERMKWGTRLQDAIALGVADDQKWAVRPMTEYMRDSELKIGSSFDYAIGDNGILEIKNVDGMIFKTQWVCDDEDSTEAPAHIELQVQHQLLVSGREFCYLAAFVGGNKAHIFKRVPNEAVFFAIKGAVINFWQSIKDNKEPKPDFNRDSEFIKKLYSFSQPGTVSDATNNTELTKLAKQYKEFSNIAKEAEKNKDAIKAEILTKIGQSEKVLGEGFTISAGLIGPAEIAFTRKGYRNFKVTWKKGE